MLENILIAIVSAGFGSIVTWIVKYELDKKHEKSSSEFEHKIRRYKSAMIFMNILLKPTNLLFIKYSHPDIKTKEDIKETLKAEYYEMLLYAPDNVIENVRKFIQSPSNQQLINTIMSMRRDLWGKVTKVEETNLTI